MKQILCLSNEPWSASPSRTQQLVSRLRDAQIAYFSPPSGPGDQSFRKKGRQVRPNVTVYTLPPILRVDERYALFFRAGCKKLSRYIAARAGRRGRPLLWTTHPAHVHLLDLLDYGGLVYDCDRAWDELPPKWEGSLAGAADVVFAASPELRDRLSPCSGNIALVPNGVNFSLFSHPGGTLPLKRLAPGPVIGFSGTLWPDLDLSPLLYAAQARPDWTFLLVSRAVRGNALLPRLRRLHNVRLVGSSSLDQVPDWLYQCDVLVELLRRGQPYSNLISPRLYEYLATGKPVVSMLWPDQVEQFPDVVYAAHDEEEFLTCCRHALEEAPGFVTQRRRDHAAAANWPLRVQEVDRILTAAGLL